jgi:hypothetical protein
MSSRGGLGKGWAMKFTMLAAAAFALAPLAHAQDCGPLNKVIASAVEEGFESISGDMLEDGYFETDISFFEADECSVDSIMGQYVCLWDRPTVADADKAIAPLYDMAKVCLSGGWEWTDIAGEQRAQQHRDHRGLSHDPHGRRAQGRGGAGLHGRHVDPAMAPGVAGSDVGVGAVARCGALAYLWRIIHPGDLPWRYWFSALQAATVPA